MYINWNLVFYFQVRRAVISAKNALMEDFVPKHLGFSHISREDVINHHTRPLAKELLCSMSDNPVILVLDGTYIYLQKSGNFSFSRRSYSTHKHRPLVKPMMIVSTSGYIISVLGPYLADSKNSDAKILSHMIQTNVEDIRKWVEEDDIFIVDRGFRDAEAFAGWLGDTCWNAILSDSSFKATLNRGSQYNQICDQGTCKI